MDYALPTWAPNDQGAAMARATWLAGLIALALSACLETRTASTNGDGGGVNPPDSLDRVLSQTFTVPAFKLESGEVLPELTLAYETYGRLAPGGRNAILVAHGFTSNHHAAGKYAATDQVAGWWDGLIGPGKALAIPTATSSCRPTCSAPRTAPRRPRARIRRPARRSACPSTSSSPASAATGSASAGSWR